MREALAQLLAAEGLNVIGQAGRADAAYELVLRRRPDVVVMDIRLGAESGLELSRRLLVSLPSLAVLLYTGEVIEPPMVETIMRTGVRGIALKTGDAGELTDAIKRVASGEEFVEPILRATRRAPQQAEHLSEREREILRLIGTGLSNEQIGQTLFLSPHTVRTHVRNSLRKLGVHSRAEAVLALERLEPPIPGME